MWTSLSTNSLSRSSRPPLWPPPRSRSPAMVFSNPCGAHLLKTSAPVLVSVQFQTLETQSAFARRVGQRLDAAVIKIAAAIEDHFLDAVLYRALRQKLADRLGRVDVGAGIAGLPQRLLQRGCRRQRLALQVVDNLRIDVLRRAEYRQTRAT